MALNLKNAQVERLAAEVAKLTGESKTEAIRRALEERRRRLKRQSVDERTEGCAGWRDALLRHERDLQVRDR
jgi:hypothetical protein